MFLTIPLFYLVSCCSGDNSIVKDVANTTNDRCFFLHNIRLPNHNLNIGNYLENYSVTLAPF